MNENSDLSFSLVSSLLEWESSQLTFHSRPNILKLLGKSAPIGSPVGPYVSTILWHRVRILCLSATFYSIFKVEKLSLNFEKNEDKPMSRGHYEIKYVKVPEGGGQLYSRLAQATTSKEIIIGFDPGD